MTNTTTAEKYTKVYDGDTLWYADTAELVAAMSLAGWTVQNETIVEPTDESDAYGFLCAAVAPVDADGIPDGTPVEALRYVVGESWGSSSDIDAALDAANMARYAERGLDLDMLTRSTRIIAGENDGHDHGMIRGYGEINGEPALDVAWDSGTSSRILAAEARIETHDEKPAHRGGRGECEGCSADVESV